mmetsp:Transcript_30278/g.75154  ORF Transcript_30278/g.75154 Transcript_30278/m.75154 type:complete len:332 (-) Transcript_30278:92-1087(-)|eukprot:CAMPEP_0197590774 /NCGR_PEP_ID=MMETSP1326-20131121/12204_1 /TAXON_ID=1155430 /ORGANISM="Genus nov. species nov., Strain RCC2288" /LENGTH=331 /DNA_ID=CAMNT_0043156037 /DNA_START=235 /DNA_END=1230 /DNA_ORIENTATION=-
MAPTSEPKNNRFTQQELPAWRPILTPAWVAGILFSIGVLFIPLGVVCMMASNSVVEVSRRYDNEPACAAGFFPTAAEQANKFSDNGTGTTCTLSITVPERMKAPVYVYYELDNFYQNHRRYVKSRSDPQLAGGDTADSFCEPQLNKASGVEGEGEVKVNPCGLIAWTFFNDSYAFSVDGAPVAVSERGIAWPSDVEHKFGAYKPSHFNDVPATRGGGVITGNVQDDEHFIVWMRTAALSNFRKLWGKIETDIEAGTVITIQVANRYNTYKFDGAKHIVLSTTSWLGGKNDFLGIAYLAIGCLCVAFGLVFVYFTFYPPRRQGDVANLSWNK